MVKQGAVGGCFSRERQELRRQSKNWDRGRISSRGGSSLLQGKVIAAIIIFGFSLFALLGFEIIDEALSFLGRIYLHT